MGTKKKRKKKPLSQSIRIYSVSHGQCSVLVSLLLLLHGANIIIIMVWITTPRQQPILNILFFTLLSPSAPLSLSFPLAFNLVSNRVEQKKWAKLCTNITNMKHEFQSMHFPHIFIGSGKWKRAKNWQIACFLTVMSELMPHSVCHKCWMCDVNLIYSVAFIRFISWLHFNWVCCCAT